jgi:exopolysaccharide production protein ExoQ
MRIATRQEALPEPVVNRPEALATAAAPQPGFFVRSLLAIFIVFSFPAFTYQLGTDASSGGWVGSTAIQIVTLASELFAIAVFLTSRDAARLLIKCWPILILIAIAFASTAWSRNPILTLQASNRFMATALLGFAVAVKLPQYRCIRFVVRTMVLGCLLSVIWVLILPDVAVHQLTDKFQFQHSGLWRGIFSHKQGLGYFAGLTIGLLFFYRTMIFPPIMLAGAMACSIACLVGTQSATGTVVAFILPCFLYAASFIARMQPHLRKPMLIKFGFLLALIGIGFKTGLLNVLIIEILGKSTDLTGRADFWPIILENFNNSGSTLLGGGFSAGFAAEMSEWSVDNGYYDKLIEFGYLGSSIIFATYGAVLLGGLRLLLTTPSAFAATNIFPFSILSVILIANVTESNIISKSLSTVLTSLAVALIFGQRRASLKNTSGETRAEYGNRAQQKARMT